MTYKKRVFLHNHRVDEAAFALHSLYYSQLGDVEMVGTSQIVLEQPTQLVSGISEDKDASLGDKDATLGDYDTDFESTATSLTKIKLNDRVQKTGRTKNDRKLRDAQDKQDRITFNASEKAKRDPGERQSNSQSQPSQLVLMGDGEIEIVTIANVGIFTRATIQDMKAFSDLRAACTRATAFCRWMQTDMAVAVRAEDQDKVKMLSSMILSKFPYYVNASLGTDYHCHMLYRLEPLHYVSYALIHALCERLECHHAGMLTAKATKKLECHHAGMLTAKATKKRREQVIDESIRSLLTLFADAEGISGVMLPVNFGNQHWCCIIVDFVGSAIRYYDPPNSRDYRTALDGLSWQISTTILTGFNVVSINSPVHH
ncbi:hypothetical protein ATCC90586_011092 [Pythium insidiosum]|nr:hypothetical protein ATCC90586_011092 [Pythium insidiosum]